jgi:hypothetical protein
METNYEASPFGSTDWSHVLHLRLADVSNQPAILETWEFQEILKEIASGTKTQLTQAGSE